MRFEEAGRRAEWVRYEGIKYKKKPEPAQKKDMVVKKVEKKVKMKKKKKRDPVYRTVKFVYSI